MVERSDGESEQVGRNWGRLLESHTFIQRQVIFFDLFSINDEHGGVFNVLQWLLRVFDECVGHANSPTWDDQSQPIHALEVGPIAHRNG